MSTFTRAKTHDPAGNRATLTTYTYDGWNVIETREKTGAQTAEYVHGANVDEIVRAEIPASGGGTMMIYHHHDALGSVIALTKENGTVVERYKYDVFGQPTFLDEFGTPLTTQRSVYGNKFLFTGREWLPLSGGYPPGSNTSSNPEPSSLPGGNQVGLYDYRNRAYTALLGRFLQTDPIRFDAGDANLYRYVGNRATGARDPMGLDAVFLVGSNIENPEYFTKIAQQMATAYESSHAGKKAHVFQVRSKDDINKAVSSVSDIDRIDYFGHGSSHKLYTSPTSGLSREDVKSLDKTNVRSDAFINLWACRTGDKPDVGDSISQSFADHFGVKTGGVNGGLSWRIPVINRITGSTNYLPRPENGFSIYSPR